MTTLTYTPTSPLPAVLRFLLFLAAGPLGAEAPEFWNETLYNVARTRKLLWDVEGNFRFRNEKAPFYDRRVATRVEIKALPRVKAIGGYLFRYRHRAGHGFGAEHRLIGGVSYELPVPAFKVTSETLYERHIGRPDRPDFNRYRQQFEFEDADAPVSPWLYQDFTFRHEGFVRSRSRAGVRYKFSDFEMKTAYQFESIKDNGAWGPRHTVFLELTVDRPLITAE